MEKNVTYMGIDYHHKSLQVCMLDAQGEVLLNRACPNDVNMLARAAGRFGGGHIEAAIEACSGSADLADETIARLGWSVSLAHPGYVKRMKQNPDKTDFSDSRMLADLMRVGYLPEVWLAPEAIRDLRRMTRYRQKLANEQRSIKQQISAYLRDQRIQDAPARPWTKAWLWWVGNAAPLTEHTRWIVQQRLEQLHQIQQAIKLTEVRLKAMIALDPLAQALLRKPGIGLVTATVMRAEIGRFERFHTGKQLSRFCGLSPRNVSSGARQADAGLIDQCNRQLRTVIIEAAHRLIRYEKRWADMAGGMLLRGKPKSLVVAAVANRWIRLLYNEFNDMKAA